MLVIINPAGPVHTVFTVTGISTAGLKYTVHIRVIEEPIGRIGLRTLLDTITKMGDGTARKNNYINAHMSYVDKLLTHF